MTRRWSTPVVVVATVVATLTAVLLLEPGLLALPGGLLRTSTHTSSLFAFARSSRAHSSESAVPARILELPEWLQKTALSALATEALPPAALFAPAQTLPVTWKPKLHAGTAATWLSSARTPSGVPPTAEVRVVDLLPPLNAAGSGVRQASPPVHSVQAVGPYHRLWVHSVWPDEAPKQDGSDADATCPPLAQGNSVPGDLAAEFGYLAKSRIGPDALGEEGLRFLAMTRPLAGQANPLVWPSMSVPQENIACTHAAKVRPEFFPQHACGLHRTEPPTHSSAWCSPWTADHFIGVLDCGWVETNARHNYVAFAVISSRLGLMSHKNHMVGLDAGKPVAEYDVLATVGYLEYADYPGHFMNEAVWRIAYLDAHLPPWVPILVPDGAVPRALLATLASPEVGLIKSNRDFVFAPHIATGGLVWRAKKLYYFGTLTPVRFPVVTWLGQNTLADALRTVFARRSASAGGPAEAQPSAGGIVLLERPAGTDRSIAGQQAELLSTLAGLLPGVPVVPHMPSINSFFSTGDLIHAATLVVGVHGAALNNLFFMRPGTGLLEIGYLNDEHQPSEFVCAARNVGVRYYAAFGESNHYGPITIDVPAIALAIAHAYKEVSTSLSNGSV